MYNIEPSPMAIVATTTTKLNDPTINPIKNDGPTTSNSFKHKNGGYFVVTALIAAQLIGL